MDRENIRYQAGETVAIVTTSSAPTVKASAHLETNVETLKGPRYVNVMGRVTNAGDTGDGTTAMWAFPMWWMHKAGAWFMGAGIKFWLAAEIEASTDGLTGNCYKLDKPQGASAFFLHTPATVSASNVLRIQVEIDT